MVATDQSLLLNQARYNGVAGLIDMPGVPAINLVLGLYDYKPQPQVVKQATELQTKSIQAQGAQGKQLLNDIDTYLGGHQRAACRRRSPTAPKFTRTDIYALNAVKSQFLGEGGGEEIDNAHVPRRAAQQVRRQGTATGASRTCAARNDPEATYTTSKAAPNQTDVRSQAQGHGAAEERLVQELVRQAPRGQGVGRRASPAPASASSRRTS